MKPPALHRFMEQLQGGDPVYGLWVTLDAPAVTDIAAGLGLDWVVVDAARGHLDWAEILEQVRATHRSNTVALVRIMEARPELIERALDAGADGVVISSIETAEQLESVVRAARNATAQTRSGRTTARAPSNVPFDRKAGADFLVVAMLDTALGVNNVHDLLQVEGVEVFFVDPSLYVATLEGAGVSASRDALVREIRSHRKHAGMIASTDEALVDYQTGGFTVLGVGSDSGIILEGIRGAIELVNKVDGSAT